MFNVYTITIGLLLLALVLSGLRIAQEYQRAVVFRLGRYHSVRGPGLYYNIPLIEWQKKVDMRTITVDVEPQETITRDSVTIKVNAVLWYRVVEPFKSILRSRRFSRGSLSDRANESPQYHRSARAR